MVPQTPHGDPQSAPGVSQGPGRPPPARAPQCAARPEAPIAVSLWYQSVPPPGKGQILWGDPAGGPHPSPSPPQGRSQGARIKLLRPLPQNVTGEAAGLDPESWPDRGAASA